MKKLIQISLVVILAFVLLQAAVGAPMVSADKIGSSVASSISSTVNVSIDEAHAVACFIRIKGVVCVTPTVGWNS